MANVFQRDRRHQRGAAMVEAAFLFPMFIILFFVSLYAHHLCAKQIDLNTQSRESTWTLAMANCNVNGTNDSETLPPSNSGGGNAPQVINLANMGSSSEAGQAARSAFSGGSVSGWLSSILGTFTSAISSFFPNPQGSQMNNTAVINWRMPNNYTGQNPTNSTTIHGTATVMCNEAPQDGSIGAVIGDLIGAVKSLFN